MKKKSLSAKKKIHKTLLKHLKNKRINKVYKEFKDSLDYNLEPIIPFTPKDCPKLGLAISGGPDSMALAFLSKCYLLKENLNGKFFIVDHKLRKESSTEAKLLKNFLRKFNINCEILHWQGKKPLSNVQAIARKNRYQLLKKACKKNNILNLLTGHHKDDVYENFFIRMLRGSGLKGLISLDKKEKVKDKNLLRPLLEQKKDDLIFTAKNVFNFYINDPTNIDQKYQRIRVRKLITELQKDGLDNKKFSKTIQNLKSSNFVVNFYVKENLKKNTFFSNKKNQLILNDNFFKHPYEVIFRSLSEVIQLIGKKYYSVRGKKLSKIINNIENNRLNKVTLGGCIIEKVNQTVIISKEH